MSVLLDCNRTAEPTTLPSDELLTAVLTPHILRRLNLDEEREVLLRGLLRTTYIEAHRDGRAAGIAAAIKAQVMGGAL